MGIGVRRRRKVFIRIIRILDGNIRSIAWGGLMSMGNLKLFSVVKW
jgi:hypothetical protein